MTRLSLERLDRELAFQTSARFGLLAGDHVRYTALGASNVDANLARAIERGEGVISVIGRMGSGKSSLIASVTDGLEEGFLPIRIRTASINAGDPAIFIRHALAEIRQADEAALSEHERRALDRASATQRRVGTSRELRAGFEIRAGKVLEGAVVGEVRRAASEEYERAVDPVEALGAMERILNIFWGIKRCPVLLVEDTDHWGGTPEAANAFFDQTARVLATLDAVTVVATQAEYTQLAGYRRMRDRFNTEVLLPRLPEVERGLTVVLEHRIRGAGVQEALQDLLDPDAMRLLADSYEESASESFAGDLRRTLAVMRAALELALDEPLAERISSGHLQEARAKSPLAPSSAWNM